MTACARFSAAADQCAAAPIGGAVHQRDARIVPPRLPDELWDLVGLDFVRPLCYTIIERELFDADEDLYI